MATDSERLARMERGQQAAIQGISGLADTVRITNAMVAEVMEWLKKPPSSDLSDTIAALSAAVAEMRQEIRDLPAKVALAISDGELDGRG